MGLFDWSKRKISQAADTYKKNSSSFGAMEAAVFDSENYNIPIEEVHYVAIDTELTGLDYKKDSIVSIGAVKMHGRRIGLGDAFYKLVKPKTELTGASVVIHGIRPLDLEEKPEIDRVLPEFLDYCGTDIIVGYVPEIDLHFINREMDRIYGLTIKNSVIDVLTVYKWIQLRSGDDYMANPSLYDIAGNLGIPVKGAHNAISDAFVTAQVLQRLLHMLVAHGIRSIGELLDVSNPSKGGDKFRYSVKINSL